MKSEAKFSREIDMLTEKIFSARCDLQMACLTTHPGVNKKFLDKACDKLIDAEYLIMRGMRWNSWNS